MTNGAYEAAARRHDPEKIVRDVVDAYRALEGKQ